MTALSLAIVGWQGALRYPGYAWRVVSEPGFGQTPPGLMPNLLGFITGWPWPPGLGIVLRMLVAAISIALIVFVARMRPLANRKGSGARGMQGGSAHGAAAESHAIFRLSFACAVIASVLVAYNTNAHDLCLLVLPLAIVADYGWADFAWDRSTRIASVLLLPIAPLLVSPFCIFLWIRWQHLNLLAPLLLCWMFVLHRKAWLLQQAPSNAATP
jgi:hypothetical protein